MIPQICAWCWTEGRLTILNGATWEQALMALDDQTVSHGMCLAHERQYRERYGIKARTA